MPPKTRLQKEDLIRKLLQQGYAFVSLPDVCTILDMTEKNLQQWSLETGDKFPLEAYWLANGPFKALIFTIVSVLEHISGAERAITILEEEGKIENG